MCDDPRNDLADQLSQELAEARDGWNEAAAEVAQLRAQLLEHAEVCKEGPWPATALRAEVLDLREQVSALESREVCTVAHDGDVATCGYCQRDALRARIAELEAMNKMLCGKLDDQRRALWDPCAPYLKDGETPAERIERERRDLTATVGLLATERRRCEDLWQQCRLGFEHREALRARVAEAERIMATYAHEGRLQSFEDRERARSEMTAWLAGASASAGGGHDG